MRARDVCGGPVISLALHPGCGCSVEQFGGKSSVSAHDDAATRHNDADTRSRRHNDGPRPRGHDGCARSGADRAAHTAYTSRLGFGGLDTHCHGNGRCGNRREEQGTHGEVSLCWIDPRLIGHAD